MLVDSGTGLELCCQPRPKLEDLVPGALGELPRGREDVETFQSLSGSFELGVMANTNAGR